MTELQVAINGILLGGLYLLMAQGLNLIFGVMRIVNFAHGIFIGISGLIVFSLYSDAGINPFIGLPIVFIVMFAFGMLTQRLLLGSFVVVSALVVFVVGAEREAADAVGLVLARRQHEHADVLGRRIRA